MLLKAYIITGSLVCLLFAIGAARGWSAPGSGLVDSSGSSGSSGGGSGWIIWGGGGGGGGRWSSGSGGWGGGK